MCLKGTSMGANWSRVSHKLVFFLIWLSLATNTGSSPNLSAKSGCLSDFRIIWACTVAVKIDSGWNCVTFAEVSTVEALVNQRIYLMWMMQHAKITQTKKSCFVPAKQWSKLLARNETWFSLLFWQRSPAHRQGVRIKRVHVGYFWLKPLLPVWMFWIQTSHSVSIYSPIVVLEYESPASWGPTRHPPKITHVIEPHYIKMGCIIIISAPW